MEYEDALWIVLGVGALGILACFTGIYWVETAELKRRASRHAD